MDGFQFIDIIIFALVAAFIIFRLRGVLGRRTGQQRRPFSTISKRESQAGEDNVVQLPDRSAPASPEDEASDEARASSESEAAREGPDGETGVAAGLRAVKRADPQFDVDGFLSGARTAYEMILISFANSDTDTLKPLLDAKVYKSFADSISEREARNETLDTTLVAMESAEVVEARMDGGMAAVTVKFVNEVVNVTRGADGEIVSGDPRAIDKVTDLWTFARDTGAGDPNWKLVSTRSPE